MQQEQQTVFERAAASVPGMDEYRGRNIYQRMAAITAELGVVAKNLSVQVTKTNSYKAVSERDILDAVKPIEEAHGVYSYPKEREIIESEILESERTYQGNTTKTTTFFSRMRTTYRFVNIDNPDEWIETVVYSEGIDTQDKGSGKAMTYADKYALMKAYKISTGDDPDQEASQTDNYSRAQRGQRQQPSYQQQAPPPQPPMQPPPAPRQESIACTACGQQLQARYNEQTGAEWSPHAIADYSVKRFGVVLCPECQTARLAQPRQ